MKNIMTAVAKFQKECPAVKKGEVNPFFNSKYADLGSIWAVIHPLLAKQGLVIVQPVVGKELKTILFHLESGESIESTYPIVAKSENNPMDAGSALTYARRYAISSLLNLHTEEDDDGVKASPTPKAETKSEPKVQGKKTKTPTEWAEHWAQKIQDADIPCDWELINTLPVEKRSFKLKEIYDKGKKDNAPF